MAEELRSEPVRERHGGANILRLVLLVMAALLVTAFACGMIDADQTSEARLPK